MDQAQFPYTAYFKLFTPDGVQVSFGVAAEQDEDHLSRLQHYMQRLSGLGFLPQMPGLEEGEKLEEVDAWVLGETSKGEPCIFLYAAAHQLQFRVATVYVEKLAELPFKVNGARRWDGDAAPTRESAEKKGYLQTVPPFRVVMEPRGLTDDGKPTWRFARVHGAAPAPATAAPAVTPAVTPVTAPASKPATAPQPSIAQQIAAIEPHLVTPGIFDEALSAADAEFHALTSASQERAPRAAAAQPPAKPQRAAGMKGQAMLQFIAWSKTFAATYPSYAKDGQPDMPHILRAVAAEGFEDVTVANCAQVCEHLTARAERAVATGAAAASK